MSRFKDQRESAKPKERIKVMFAVTTLGHNVKTDVTKFISEVEKNNFDPNHPFVYGHMLVEDYRPVDYARNVAVQNFLDSGADVLWFIDYDMIPPPNSLDMLGAMFGLNPDGTWIDRGIDLVVPIMYGIRNKQLFPCCFKYEPGYGDQLFSIAIPPQAQGLIPVDGCGTGFLAIRRRVFENPKTMTHNVEGQPRAWFTTTFWPWGQVKQSEDLTFTSNAVKAGHKLVCMPSVRVGHWKEVDLLDLERSQLSTEIDKAIENKGANPITEAHG